MRLQETLNLFVGFPAGTIVLRRDSVEPNLDACFIMRHSKGGDERMRERVCAILPAPFALARHQI